MIEKRVCLTTITANYHRVTDSSAGKEPAQSPLGNFRWINKQRDAAVRQLNFYKEMISLIPPSSLLDAVPVSRALSLKTSVRQGSGSGETTLFLAVI